MEQRVFRAAHLVQWNLRMSRDITEPMQDKVVEAVLHHQGIPFEHTDEFRNLYSHSKLAEQLEHYDHHFALISSNELAQDGLNQAFRMFARPKSQSKLVSVSLTEEATALFNLLSIKGEKSAGLTAYGETKIEAFTVGLDKAIKILTADKAPSPCLAGARTQREGKTRLVWMYPLEMTILEAVIARPLIDYFKGIDHQMTFGDFSHEIGSRMRNSAARNKFHCSIDYSQFDASVGPGFIHAAFNAFRTWFDLEQEVYPSVKLGKVFDIVERYFITTPIVMPNDRGKYPILHTGKKGGVPSGSYFTQLVDSFANLACLMAVSKRFSLGIHDEDIYVLGDDCLFFCNSDVSSKIAQISKFLVTLGFQVNTEKGSSGSSTEPVEYLGREWCNGFPIRDYSKLTRGALYPEKYRRYSPDRGTRMQQALNVIGSYLLTSYVRGLPVRTEAFRTSYAVTPATTTGITRYLMEEGLMPGNVLKRAIY
jgi:hypothetical protein